MCFTVFLLSNLLFMEIFLTIVIILGIIVIFNRKAFSKHKDQSNYAISALIAKYTYESLDKDEQARVDVESLNIMHDRVLKDSGLELDSYDKSMKMVKSTLESKKTENIWWYWLFIAMVLMELKIQTPCNEEWHISEAPFLELQNEEKYAIKWMREYLKDRYNIIVA